MDLFNNALLKRSILDYFYYFSVAHAFRINFWQQAPHTYAAKTLRNLFI